MSVNTLIEPLTRSLKDLGDKAERLKDKLTTEEATKMALVVPFLQALGYDTSDPTEVVPEFIADVGIKKGEKIDYAIMRDGQPILIIECKHWKEKLDVHHSQLYRYFNTLPTRFAILTNGLQYRFFADTSEPNKMDADPFLEITITELREIYVKEIVKFHKSIFSENDILTTANELKYTTAIKQFLSEKVLKPSSDFMSFVLKDIHTGKVTQKVIEQYTPIFETAWQQLTGDIVTGRLQNALKAENTLSPPPTPVETVVAEPETEESKVVTTAEELEAFYIVKSILRGRLEAERIYYRDNATYFSVIIDNNNRKPICRLYFNNAKKQLGIIGDDKKESKYVLERLDDLYKFADSLIEQALKYA